MAATVIPCTEHDYLEQDPPLRGQNFACVSFISPEKVLLRKDVFQLSCFLEALSDDVRQMLDSMRQHHAQKGMAAGSDNETTPGSAPQEEETTSPMISTIDSVCERHKYLWDRMELQRQFEMFCSCTSADLDRRFLEETGEFHTSVRGLKIRGVYDTIQEARDAAHHFRALDGNRHDVYVSQVGCWCPWHPEPDQVGSSEYLETQLNTLMKSYNDNFMAKDDVFEQRRQQIITAAAATGHGEKNNDDDRREDAVDNQNHPSEAFPRTLVGPKIPDSLEN
jgi:hypothetical protein